MWVFLSVWLSIWLFSESDVKKRGNFWFWFPDLLGYTVISEKLKKLNSFDSPLRKLRFFLWMGLNLESCLVRGTFLCNDFFSWSKKKLFGHKNFENPCSMTKVPQCYFWKGANLALLSYCVNFQKILLQNFFF